MLFKRPALIYRQLDTHLQPSHVVHELPTMRVDDVEPILKEACSQVYPESAICVQRFDDSLNSAIRITYRISLRSSSLREPRYPLLRVVLCFVLMLTILEIVESMPNKSRPQLIQLFSP